MYLQQNFKSTKLPGFIIIFTIGVTTLLYSQPKGRSFSLPEQANSSDYSPGYVLAKLKQNHRDLFRNQTGRTTSAIQQSVGVTGVREMVSEKLLAKGRTSKGPRRSQSHIDMGLYYEISCDPGRDIESFINELYQTGYFEVVEPDYVNRMFFAPNDPAASLQYYLQTVRAYEAWDVSQGDESVTIAIVDSGGDLVHEDLVANLYTNTLDPVDGIDNDGNGYIDDFQGWDFVGSDAANLNIPGFLGDNNPQIVAGGNLAHGVSVAGCASARSNNSKGIAGIGFKTKLMFTKHSADNQDPNSLSIYAGYSGVLYAASLGAQIINCSWGGSFRSEITQDLINFVTIDLGSLVVAAAGNNGQEAPFYPAAYDNVLSVSATTQLNGKASFSNYGSFVDVAAPGVGIYTTTFGHSYTYIQGTSFSSPIVAGAAALVKARFPAFTPQQIAEQIRVTSNSSLLNSSIPAGFVNKMGFGILDVFAALTKSTPALRASLPKLVNSSGSPPSAGEMGFLTLSFKNELAATSSGVEISITSGSNLVTVVQGVFRPGIIPAGGLITNNLTPFQIQIAASLPENFPLPLKISYKDGTYVDQETITYILNPSYIDVNENLVTTTISGTARIGFEDTQNNAKGSGFVFDQNSLLYEMGIIMGTGTGSLYNNVRGTTGVYDQDFVTIQPKIKKIIPGERSTSEIFGTVSNSITQASKAFQLNYRSLVWREAPDDKYVIMEYIISNPTASPITNFHFGIFADWDISANGAADAANWDNANKLGYVYPVTDVTLPHAGIQLLTGTAEYFAIDNSQTIAGNPFGLYDGFTDNEKFQTISTGLARLTAGMTTPSGNDVSHVVGSGPYTIPAGQQIKIAFALHAAPNLSALQLSSQQADLMYNFTLNAPKPVVAEVSTCYGSPASITASGAGSFKWYTGFTGGTSFLTGANYNTPNLYNDTTFYVSNADNSYESVRTPARVLVKANPTISTSGSTIMCSNESITLSVAIADSYLWSTGATTKTIVVTTPGSYSVSVNSILPACSSSSTPVTVTTIPAPQSVFAIATGANLKTHIPIQFTDQSVGATSWLWNFGNTQTSTDQNPTTTYTSGQSYTVTLTARAANGCQSTSTQNIDIITGLEDSGTTEIFEVYPNPFESKLVVSFSGPATSAISIQLFDIHGRVIFSSGPSLSSLYEIPTSAIPSGMYVLKVYHDNRVSAKKVIKIY